jgi:predicted nuclease with TOPRIM domain
MENMDLLSKIFEGFERCTTRLVDHMTATFKRESELTSCEIFDMKKRMDNLEAENAKIIKENAELKKSLETLKLKQENNETSVDELEQNKISDEVVFTGDFQIGSPNAQNLSSFIKKNL